MVRYGKDQDVKYETKPLLLKKKIKYTKSNNPIQPEMIKSLKNKIK